MRISSFENQTAYLKKLGCRHSRSLLVFSVFPEASWPNLSLGIFGLQGSIFIQEIRIPRLLEANKSLQTMEFTFEKAMKIWKDSSALPSFHGI